MNPPGLKRTRRHLPHWEIDGGTYFITFRLKHGELSSAERQMIFDHILAGDAQYYHLHALMVMPDHVHMLAQPNSNVSLSRMMKGIKGATARKLNQQRGTTGPIWQEESYDRIIRDADEFNKKANYMYENPWRAGLVTRPEDYPFWHLAKPP
ncbi:MAG: transposase [Planctomycetes bacterium]|jgi:REP element-mobilizing transposase RayT|nr:transposase [Planctomycetota bacterium]